MAQQSAAQIGSPRITWMNARPYAFASLGADYAQALEVLALAKEAEVKRLRVNPKWVPIADKNPTTARFSEYSSFLLDPLTLRLFFAIRTTYRHLLTELGQAPRPRFIQCWFNVHRGGEALVRHKHPYAFIGTFSAHAAGSVTRYGGSKEPAEDDVLIEHEPGQLMVTTGPHHYHDTSMWNDPTRARVTYAFDIVDAADWNPRQIFLPFDM